MDKHADGRFIFFHDGSNFRYFEAGEEAEGDGFGTIRGESGELLGDLIELKVLVNRFFVVIGGGELVSDIIDGRLGALLAIAVHDFVTGDADEPRTETALVAKAGKAFESGQEGLGGDILGFLDVVDADETVAIDPGDISLIEGVEVY